MTKMKNKSHEKGDNKIGKKLFMTSTYLLIYIYICTYWHIHMRLSETKEKNEVAHTYLRVCACKYVCILYVSSI